MGAMATVGLVLTWLGWILLVFTIGAWVGTVMCERRYKRRLKIADDYIRSLERHAK